MKKFLHIPMVLAVVTSALVGCSSKGEKTEKIKPNKLPVIQATQSIQQIYSIKGKSANKYEPSRLQLEQVDGVYFSADTEGHVQATKDGKVIWNKRPVKALSAGVSYGDGQLIIGAKNGQLIALNAQTGETLWQKQLSGSILSPSLITGSRILTVTNDGVLYANDFQTGQQLWSFNLPSTSLSIRGNAVPVMLDGRTVAIATADAYVIAVDSITGIPVWQTKVAISEGRSEIQRLIDVDGQPQVIGSLLVTTSFQGQVTVTDMVNQRVLWAIPASSLNSAAVDRQAVYVTTTDGRLIAYDLQSGQTLWENDKLLNRKLSNPVLLNGILVVGDLDGVLHLINPITGEITGRANTKDAVSTLRVEDNLLFVSTAKGNFSVWKN